MNGPSRRRRTAIALPCALALSLAPEAANAQYLASFSSQGGGILGVILGAAGLVGAALAIDGTANSESCSRGPHHDDSLCGGFIAGSAAATVASLAFVGLGIYVLAAPQPARRMSLPRYLAALPAPPLLELAPTPHGLLLRASF